MSSEITIHVSCHCRNFSTSLTLPSAAFPLKSSVCHCNICRHSSGHLFGTFMVIPLPYSQIPSTKGLIGYKSSDKLTRWFCQTCGARCWQDDRTGGDQESDWEWEIPVGIVDRVEQDGQVRTKRLSGLLNRVQMWIDDTNDGGCAVFINGGKLEGMDRRLTGRSSDIIDDERLQHIMSQAQTEQQPKLSEKDFVAACHCKAVQFAVNKHAISLNHDAGLDACESCRKTTGSEITAWISVDMDNLSFTDGKPLDLGADCFSRYSTSPQVLRYFCKFCGASIFYRNLDRGNTIDICLGVIRLHNARGEPYLAWKKYGERQIAYIEDAIDPDFVDGLVRGSKTHQSRLETMQ